MATQTLRSALSPDLIAKIKPVTLSGERVLPVPEVLASLFPWGGIQRGTSLAVTGPAGWSLAMAVMVEALGQEGWMAVVGIPDLHLLAAADLGVRLDRVIVVEDPGPGRWSTVVATLLESVEVVAVAPTFPVGNRDVRRLTARAREQESVILQLEPSCGPRRFAISPDLTLDTAVEGWEGMGFGHGYLRQRRVNIRANGRRSGSAATASRSVWLPDRDGLLS